MGYWREIKMAGYWPSSLIFCVIMERDEAEVHKHAKKDEANTSLVKKMTVYYMTRRTPKTVQ